MQPCVVPPILLWAAAYSTAPRPLAISFAPYAARGRACSGSSSFAATSGVNRGMGKMPASWRASRTGLRAIELTGGRFLSVPGPVAAQRHPHAAINLVDTPQRACRGQDHPQRVCPDDALAFPTLLWAQPRAGVGVTDGYVHRPAVARLRADVLRAQGERGREKRLDRWGWLAVASPFGAALALTPYDHD